MVVAVSIFLPGLRAPLYKIQATCQISVLNISWLPQYFCPILSAYVNSFYTKRLFQDWSKSYLYCWSYVTLTFWQCFEREINRIPTVISRAEVSKCRNRMIWWHTLFIEYKNVKSGLRNIHNIVIISIFPQSWNKHQKTHFTKLQDTSKLPNFYIVEGSRNASLVIICCFRSL